MQYHIIILGNLAVSRLIFRPKCQHNSLFLFLNDLPKKAGRRKSLKSTVRNFVRSFNLSHQAANIVMRIYYFSTQSSCDGRLTEKIVELIMNSSLVWSDNVYYNAVFRQPRWRHCIRTADHKVNRRFLRISWSGFIDSRLVAWSAVHCSHIFYIVVPSRPFLPLPM